MSDEIFVCEVCVMIR